MSRLYDLSISLVTEPWSHFLPCVALRPDPFRYTALKHGVAKTESTCGDVGETRAGHREQKKERPRERMPRVCSGNSQQPYSGSEPVMTSNMK